MLQWVLVRFGHSSITIAHYMRLSPLSFPMKNEALCKILAHNIRCLVQAMFEFGIRPDFCSLATYQATIA